MISPIQEIKSFVAENRTSDALSRLLELSQSNKQIHDSILIVLSEFNALNAQRLRSTIKSEEATLRYSEINKKVLMALDSFDSQGKVLPENGSIKKKSIVIILGNLALLFGVLVIVVAILELLFNERGTVINKGRIIPFITPLFLWVFFWTFVAYLIALLVSVSKAK